jgi:hypothetical protein
LIVESPCRLLQTKKEVIVRNRIFAIGKKLNQQAKESIAKNLFIEPMLGKQLDIVDDAQRKRNLSKSISQTGKRAD